MNHSWALFIPILFPIVAGASAFLFRFRSRKILYCYSFAVVTLNSLCVALLLFAQPDGIFTLIHITDELSLAFQIDGLGTVFAALVAFLWPLATLYAFEYMKHEERHTMFFAFYTMTYGVTVGIAFSANAMTMYLFYEFLTLITTPLVFHTQTKEANRAARKYLCYSISGAALGFIVVIFVMVYGWTMNFTYGGVLNTELLWFDDNIMLLVYVLAFIGFGVKAAIFPLHGWLPSASVAPTPVTALLHAVAVVKAGVFAIMRMTFYIFGVDFLRGTWAQVVVTVIALLTILYGSTMAVKETHFKRRLAYSTISNLSYILMGVALMTPLGFLGALTHMVFHAIMKICSFFCAGAVMVQTGKQYVDELQGLGKKMPVTFGCFTVASLSLVGMPPLIGFISKFNLATAAIEAGGILSYLSVVVLFFSAILVAVYMLFIVIKAFFPRMDAPDPGEAKDPGWRMKLPILVFTAFIIVAGIYSDPIIQYLSGVASGLL